MSVRVLRVRAARVVAMDRVALRAVVNAPTKAVTKAAAIKVTNIVARAVVVTKVPPVKDASSVAERGVVVRKISAKLRVRAAKAVATDRAVLKGVANVATSAETKLRALLKPSALGLFSKAKSVTTKNRRMAAPAVSPAVTTPKV
jgi:hypothetical protein